MSNEAPPSSHAEERRPPAAGLLPASQDPTAESGEGRRRGRTRFAVIGVAIVVAVAVLAAVLLAGTDEGPPTRYSVTTLAGARHLGDGGAATEAVLIEPSGVAVTPDGALFIADDVTHRLRRIDPDGSIRTVAGTGSAGFDGEAAPGLVGRLNQPQQLAADDAGNVYIADTGNQRVRRLSPEGVITTIAGTGDAGYDGDGGRATGAKLSSPFAVAALGSGAVVIADTGNRVIRQVGADGRITTVAGTGAAGTGGDGGPGTAAQFLEPIGVAVAGDGSLLVADRTAGTVRRMDRDGIITTVAYFPGAVPAGASPPPGAAVLGGRPFALATLASGDVAVAEPSADRVELLTEGGSVAGAVEVLAAEGLRGPRALTAGKNGVIVADTGNRLVVSIAPDKGRTRVAGSGSWGRQQAGSTARDLWLLRPGGVAVDAKGNAYVSDTTAHLVWRIDPDGAAAPFAGTGIAGFSGDGGPAVAARLSSPQALAFDDAGGLLIADANNLRVRRVAPDGTISTFAGTGAAPSPTPPAGSASGSTPVAPVAIAATKGAVAITEPQLGRVLVVSNGVVHTVAEGIVRGGLLGVPSALAFDPQGTLFVSDVATHRVFRLRASGSAEAPWAVAPEITVAAGTGAPGFDGDGPAATGRLAAPQGLLAVGVDDLLVADTGNNVVGRLAGGALTTVAGNGEPGAAGDGLVVLEGRLGAPTALALTGDEALLVLQPDLGLVRSMSGPGGRLGTFAGVGPLGRLGDRGQATRATFASPSAVALGPDGTVYVADTNHHRVRAIATNGRIRTIAGTGLPGGAGIGDTATRAELSYPQGVAVTADGRVYIADTANHRVVELDKDGRLQLVAGTGTAGAPEDGTKATESPLSEPLAVALAADGAVVVSDGGSGTVVSIAPYGTLRVLATGLGRPNGLAVDPDGSVWVAVEISNQVVRIPASGAKPEVVAGTGRPGMLGDGGPATKAQLANPAGLALGPDGDVFVSDALNARVRRIDAKGRITTVAGNGMVAPGDDRAASDEASFALPLGLAVRPDGTVLVADTFNDRIRLLTPRS